MRTPTRFHLWCLFGYGMLAVAPPARADPTAQDDPAQRQERAPPGARSTRPPRTPLALEFRTEPRTPTEFLQLRPECGTMKYFGEGMHAATRAAGDSLVRVADWVLPDLGVRFQRGRSTVPLLMWSVALPIGPVTVREVERYHCAPPRVSEFRPMHLVPELGVTLSGDPSHWIRLGYEIVWHARGTNWGVVAGLGPALAPREGSPDLLLSPEVGVRFGRCCEPNFLAFVARYEHALIGERAPSVVLKLALTQW